MRWVRLQVLVLGCGMRAEPLPKDVAEYLAKKNIKVEVLDSVRKLHHAVGQVITCSL